LAIGDAGNALDSTLYNFWGLGLTNTGILRYQTPSSCTHAFYVNDTASTEVVGITTNKMYINGRLDINTGIAGNYNMSISNNGLTSLTTGTNNIIIGNNCGGALTTGSGNVAIGKDCFSIATTATGCVSIGRISMANANGNVNTGCGVNTLGYNTGGYNSAFGSSALSQLSTGVNCVGVGVTAGYSSQVSSNNTFIGCFSDISADTWSNSSCLGYQSVITASNQVTLGNTSTTNVVSSGVISGPLINGSGFTTPNNGNGAYVGWNRSGGVAETNFITNTPYGSSGSGQGGWEWVTRTSSDGVYGRRMYLDGANGNLNLPSITPTGSGLGTSTPLNHYEEYTHNTSFVGPVTVGVYGLHLVRIGTMITYYMANSPLVSTATASQLTWSANVVLPSRFRPPTAINTVVVGRNNNVLTLMNVVIDSSGNMIISVALTSSFFVGTIGFNTFSMSWTV
jgi:hypothetical protein